MKFYRIDWRDSEPTAQQTEWTTSEREAQRYARESGDPDVRITRMDIPMTRLGMLGFLREHIWCDAGRAIAQAQDR